MFPKAIILTNVRQHGLHFGNKPFSKPFKSKLDERRLDCNWPVTVSDILEAHVFVTLTL